ncbi:MAG: FHA domain-containing protein [Nanoarchaeota archaeon]|nr:FHA domain-containing protein [Nanoarchaeota archaeon]
MKTTILVHKATNTRYELPEKKEVPIGREKNCDIQIPQKFTSVSRHHGTIIQDEKGVSIRDNGSKNRTRVRGKSLSKDECASLSNGDIIHLGNYILEVIILDPNEEVKLTTDSDKKKITPDGPLTEAEIVENLLKIEEDEDLNNKEFGLKELE